MIQKRTYKLTPEIREGIINGFRKGLPKRVICGIVAIDPETLNRWLNASKAGEAEFAGFYEECAQAKAERIEYLASKVDEISEERRDWRGYFALLSKECPQHYGSINQAYVSKELDFLLNVADQFFSDRPNGTQDYMDFLSKIQEEGKSNQYEIDLL